MALPALRATVLLTTATAAAGTLLYENHEPFRLWADDVGGRAQAAWVGLKEELKELRDDIEGHAQRRRETPFGTRAGQWEGVGPSQHRGAGPWRRRRSRRGSSVERNTEKQEPQAAATGVDPEHAGAVRRRRPSVSKESDENPMSDTSLAAEVPHSAPSPRSRSASTESMRSARDNLESEPELVLTPTMSHSASTLDADTGDESISVISTPSENDTRSVDEEVMTPTSGAMTPTSADEMLDYDELVREGEEARSQTAGRKGMEETAEGDVDDARSEVSSVSDWSRVSQDVLPA